MTDEEGRPLEDADESGAMLCSFWAGTFEARERHYQDHSCETIFGCVQGAPDDIQLSLCQGKLDDMLVSKKDSALGPDGLSCSVYRCAGGIGAKLFFTGYENLVAR